MNIDYHAHAQVTEEELSEEAHTASKNGKEGDNGKRHLPDELCRPNGDVLCRTAFDTIDTTFVRGPNPFV